MGPDDKICYCYNVSLRKLWNYARRNKIQRPSQMSECLGAGGGCGWCIPILKRIHEESHSPDNVDFVIDVSPEEYAESRKKYIKDKKPENTF